MSEDTLAIVTSLLTNDTTNIVELSTAEFTAYMVVGIPSWILYILVIIVLIKPSNQIVFGNSYYRLVVAIGLLVRLCSFLLMQLRVYRIYCYISFSISNSDSRYMLQLQSSMLKFLTEVSSSSSSSLQHTSYGTSKVV